jgi:hypothetical protein
MNDPVNEMVGRYSGYGRSTPETGGFAVNVELSLKVDGTCGLRVSSYEDYRTRTPAPWSAEGRWSTSADGTIQITVAEAMLRYRFDPLTPYDLSHGPYKRKVAIRGLIPAGGNGSIGLAARQELFAEVDSSVPFEAWARSAEAVLAETTLFDSDACMAALITSSAEGIPGSTVTRLNGRSIQVSKPRPGSRPPAVTGPRDDLMKRILGWLRER